MPQLFAARFEEAWVEWGPDAGGEGLVVVNLDARIGARRSKLKLKLTDELDCVVVEVSRRALRVVYRGLPFTISARGDAPFLIGDIVSVACDG